MSERLDHEEEQHCGGDEERHQRGDELAVCEDRAVDGEGESIEGGLPEDRTDQRGNERGGECADHCGECGTDGHGDGEVDHIAPEDESSEFEEDAGFLRRTVPRLAHVQQRTEPPTGRGVGRAGGGTRTHDLTITNRLR